MMEFLMVLYIYSMGNKIVNWWNDQSEWVLNQQE